MHHARSFVFAVVFFLVASVGACAAYVWFERAVEASGPLQEPTVVIISLGESLPMIAESLAKAKVINHTWLFELEARRQAKARSLKPGEYQFNAGVSVSDVLKKIVERDVVMHFVTIRLRTTINKVVN